MYKPVPNWGQGSLELMAVPRLGVLRMRTAGPVKPRTASRGTLTKSGKLCQKWNKSTPHRPKSHIVENVKKITGYTDHNQCVRAYSGSPRTRDTNMGSTGNFWGSLNVNEVLVSTVVANICHQHRCYWSHEKILVLHYRFKNSLGKLYMHRRKSKL